MIIFSSNLIFSLEPEINLASIQSKQFINVKLGGEVGKELKKYKDKLKKNQIFIYTNCHQCFTPPFYKIIYD